MPTVHLPVTLLSSRGGGTKSTLLKVNTPPLESSSHLPSSSPIPRPTAPSHPFPARTESQTFSLFFKQWRAIHSSTRSFALTFHSRFFSSLQNETRISQQMPKAQSGPADQGLEGQGGFKLPHVPTGLAAPPDGGLGPCSPDGGLGPCSSTTCPAESQEVSLPLLALASSRTMSVGTFSGAFLSSAFPLQLSLPPPRDLAQPVSRLTTERGAFLGGLAGPPAPPLAWVVKGHLLSPPAQPRKLAQWATTS